MADKKATDENQQPNYESVARQALNQLARIFSKQEFDSKDLAMGRLAATTLSAHSRIRQADGARIATTFMMARELAQSPEELAAYITLTMPSHPLARAIPSVAETKMLAPVAGASD